jgi:SAM-dependent methyltransferase
MSISSSIITAKNKIKPSRGLIDMMEAGVIIGTVLDYGCGKGTDLRYLELIKPNTIISGYDPNFFPDLPTKQFDTVFCNNVINYIKSKEDIRSMLFTIKQKLLIGGNFILVARSKGEVKGNIKRNKNWKEDVNTGGYISDKNLYQRGYDSSELVELIKSVGMQPLEDKYKIPPVPYAYVIATK